MKFKPSEIIKPTVVLALICIVTSALLAYTNSLTAPKIEELAIQNEINSRKLVLSSAADFEESSLDDLTYYIGKDSADNTVGYVFTTVSKGYGGDVKVMVGVNADGTVSGVEALELNETPGLGMNAQNPDFLAQFVGKVLGIDVAKNNPAENEIQALTGATITSGAITSAVNTALEYHAEITGGADNG